MKRAMSAAGAFSSPVPPSSRIVVLVLISQAVSAIQSCRLRPDSTRVRRCGSLRINRMRPGRTVLRTAVIPPAASTEPRNDPQRSRHQRSRAARGESRGAHLRDAGLASSRTGTNWPHPDFDLILADNRWRDRCREIARAREIVCDFLVGDNEYGSTAESFDRYFLHFAMAARRDR